MMSPGGPYELKIEGNGNVRRFFSAFPKEAAEDTPAIRRNAPRNVSLIFIRFSVAPAFRRLESLSMWGQPPRLSVKLDSVCVAGGILQPAIPASGQTICVNKKAPPQRSLPIMQNCVSPNANKGSALLSDPHRKDKGNDGHYKTTNNQRKSHQPRSKSSHQERSHAKSKHQHLKIPLRPEAPRQNK